jgi:hypothetical protein
MTQKQILMQYAVMSMTRTTVYLDEDVLRAVKIKAARSGKRNSQVIEESLSRDLGLDGLAEIWNKVTPAPEERGMKFATSELHLLRKEGREGGGSLIQALSSPR